MLIGYSMTSAGAQTNYGTASRVRRRLSGETVTAEWRWLDGRREDGTPWRSAGFRRVAGGGRRIGAGAARACRRGRRAAPPARRDDRRSAPHRPVPDPAAGPRRRQRIAVSLDRRIGFGDWPGLRLDRLGLGQSGG